MQPCILDRRKMRYPFGRCSQCGYEFDFALRKTYGVTHCPKCGAPIDDFLHTVNGTERDIYCEDCGRRIFEWTNSEGAGDWIDGYAGVCSGPCERELCGKCGAWDDSGECPRCSGVPFGPLPNPRPSLFSWKNRLAKAVTFIFRRNYE